MDSYARERFDALNNRLTECRSCPRLVEWREQVAEEKRKSFSEDIYWGRPIPNFGDASATRLIVGLAPAAHGANRTGRMFTGDRSGDFLFASLFRLGVANQPTSIDANDGLTLTDVLITAAVHCAPPANKPLPSEIQECRPFLLETFAIRPWKSILCLGSLAWIQAFNVLRAQGSYIGPAPKFGHLATTQVANGPKIVGSYHPSQQNTFTGKLTPEMIDAAISEFLA